MPRAAMGCVAVLVILAGVASVWGQEGTADTPATTTAGATTEPATQPATTKAEERVTTGQALVRKLKEGGNTMWFLLVASVVGLGCVVERLVHLRRGVIIPRGMAEKADELWRAGKIDEVRKMEAKSNCTMARVLAVLARHREADLTEVSTLAGDAASRDLKRHLQKAYPLAVVATISPLLGLFGTVLGMIGAFDKVSAAGSLGDASLLGGDISKALITTAAGLAIAIPALAMYHFFKSRTQLYGIMLEEEVGELISSWFSTRPAAAAGEKAPTPAGKV